MAIHGIHRRTGPSAAVAVRRPRRAGLLTLAGTALVAWACAPQREGPSPRLAENEALARALMADWEAGDVEEAVALFAPGAVYDDFSNSMQYRGGEEIAGYLAQIHRWASDVVVNVTDVHASAEGATVEWVLSAVQTSPIPGRVTEATGREVVLNGVTILEVEGGFIERAADYVDALPLVLQLGGRVEMPGGTVIELPPGS